MTDVRYIGVVKVVVTYETPEGRLESVTNATPVSDGDSINSRMCHMAQLALSSFAGGPGLVKVKFNERE